MEQVILVDSRDNAIGTMEKYEAHHKGLLHRAFSILLFNSRGQLMLQQRAATKYHSAGLWSNTCCSHPQSDEALASAVKRRLRQEMEIEAPIHPLYKFIYRFEFSPDLVEHELDHVFYGETDAEPKLNKDEASAWCWVSWEELKRDIKDNKNAYTFWFKMIVERIVSDPVMLPEHLRPR
jgi:isopentenyl-diphosphate delta-isomerase